MEARALNALAESFVSLCGSGGSSVLDHLSLQFDGADILMKPFPSGFKASAESAIKERTGYKINLVGKMQSFSSTR